MTTRIATYTHDSPRFLVRITDGRLYLRTDGNWLPVTKAELRRDYGHVHALWHWLREHGIKKPNSGPSGASTSEADRQATGYGRMFWRPRQEVIEALGRVAERWGCSPTEALSRLVLREDKKS